MPIINNTVVQNLKFAKKINLINALITKIITNSKGRKKLLESIDMFMA